MARGRTIVSGQEYTGRAKNYRKNISLGSLATVFQTEVMAILRCAELLTVRTTTKKKIIICTDSRAAISALAKPYTESLVVWDCMTHLKGYAHQTR